MRKIVFLWATLTVAACSQQDDNEGAATAEICSQLEAVIVEDQKGAGQLFAWAVRDAVNPQLRDEDLDDLEGNRQFEERLRRGEALYHTKLNSSLILMQHHGCALPNEYPSWRAYAAPATECSRARDAETADADRLCDQSTWEPSRPDRERRPVPLPDNNSESE